jgi:cytochrome c oxidase subunit 1
MIGAKDMAFPKLNMLSYWFMWPAFITICLSFTAFGGAASNGWTSYATIASSTMPAGEGFESPANMGSGHGQIMWLIALTFVGVSSMMGSVNYVTTIINMRAPGMTLFRMPMSVWALFITAILQAMALPVLTVALILQLLDKTFNTSFFLPPAGMAFGNWQTGPGGGQPLLWQHLFWFYSHPAVYIMILPGMGVINELVSCFSRKAVFGYKFVAWASLAIAALGFLVWGHHMFVSGQSLLAGLVFSFMSFMVAVPSAIKVFNWTATLHKGSIRFDAPMLYALAFIGLFTIGGLTGLFLACLAYDVQATDTYFVVAHFHYIMVGGMVTAYFGGLHYWWPKITGRLYSEYWARTAAVLIFLGFNLTFFPLFIVGAEGMPRRYYVYPPEFQVWNVLSSGGAVILAAAYLMPMFYLGYSLFFGKRAPANPWDAPGLEWQTPSPPPEHNFDIQPVVTRAPYQYSPDFEAEPQNA